MPISVNDPTVYTDDVGKYTTGANVLADLNTIIMQVNIDSASITAIGTGSYTFTGLKTFSNGIATDTIAEKTSATGVTIDGCLIKDGAVVPTIASDPAALINGMVWYNSATGLLKAQINGTTTTLSGGGYSKGFQATAAPVYATPTTLTVGTIACRDGTNVSDITKASSTTCNIGTSGANGLDTGTVANNTWYYLYVISQVAGGNPALLLSVTNEVVTGSITLPGSYTLKRQLPFAVRTDGSATFREWRTVNWGPNPTILYVDQTNSGYNGSYVTGTANVLTTGTAASFTSVSCTSWVPPISRNALLHIASAGVSASYGRVRAAGRSDTGQRISAGVPHYTKQWQPLNSSQAFEYIGDAYGSGFNIDVAGYAVTEGVF